MLILSLQLLAALLQVAVIFVWIWQHVIMNRARRDGMFVEDDPANSAQESLTVIVPARNEATRITDTLQHLLSQDYPDFRIVVVDDRSDDDTAGMVRAAAGGDPRVSVQRIETLPKGWMGKSHAMWCAAQQATTHWLMFVDADCHVLPRGLVNAVHYAGTGTLDMLSIWPRDGSVGFWERLLLPLCGAMIVIWYGRSARDKDHVAFANGQFLLVRREVYFSVDGHRAVRDALIEDIPLARRFRAAGFRIASAIGPDICCVRMYASLRELFRGWQRIYIGVLTPLQIALCMASIVVGSLTPFITIPICLSRVLHGGGLVWQVFCGLGVLHLAMLMTTSVRFFSIARCRIRYLWLYPLSCIGVLLILGAALFKSLRKSNVEWRGTHYQVRRTRIEA
ncbi:MAG: glycosyltransferase [Phycisphaerae bacterium]|nr:glycosyltransferase [Phycisphaerae bacterium]